MKPYRTITFSWDNRRALQSLYVQTKNELVRGLISLATYQNDFDCNNTQFRMILNELINEYKVLQQEALSSSNKEVTPDLTGLIANTNLILEYTLKEINKGDFVSEINLSTYLAKLSQNTTTIITNYAKVVDFLNQKIGVVSSEHRKSLLENIRDFSPIRKLLLGTAFVSTVGAAGDHRMQGFKKNNITNHNIEIVKENNTSIPPKSKIISASSLQLASKQNNQNLSANSITVTPRDTMVTNVPTIKSPNANDIRLATKMDRTIKEFKNPITAPPGYKFLFAENAAIITAYTPTGEGLMGGVNPDGTPYEETGKTSTNFSATTNFDGVAVDPKIIPYGALIYIQGVGWKIADDTGARMRHTWRQHHRVHIDLRVKKITQEVLDTTGERKILVFKSMSKKDYYDRVKDARSGFKDEDSNIFKYMTSNR